MDSSQCNRDQRSKEWILTLLTTVLQQSSERKAFAVEEDNLRIHLCHRRRKLQYRKEMLEKQVPALK